MEKEAQAKHISGVDLILPGGVALLLFRCCELAFVASTYCDYSFLIKYASYILFS